MVMVRMAGGVISKLVVSDPTEKLSSLVLQVNAPVDLTGTNVKASWNKDSKLSDIMVTLPTLGYAGKSVVMDMGKK